MGKFYGKVLFAQTNVEVRPGVWKDQITQRPYYGDELKLVSRQQQGDGINDNLNIDNQLSIVADPFAYENFSSMKAVELMGSFWKITSVEVRRPRLILTIGGVYNGPTS